MTQLPTWREEAIDKRHDRKSFDCGQAELNAFFAQYARQSHDGGSAKTYCAIDRADGKTVLGFYTISPAQVDLHRIPLEARPPGAPRHALGGFRLARLAVAKQFHGHSLGGQMLANAIERCMLVSLQVGGTALFIDAKDAAAARWYARYGARPLEDRALSLVMSFAEFAKAKLAAGA